MKVFSYNNYIRCIHHLRLNAVMQFAEETSQYGETKNTHDKLAKIILKDTNEVIQFINNFVKPNEKLKEGEIIKYTNSFINKKYRYKEADLVYKIRSKNIFFLIEHQSKVDKNMPSRLINYCIDIIYEWSRTGTNLKGKIKYPIVVPIVIYTGKEKWNIPQNFNKAQEDDENYNNYKIGMKYNLVEINKISAERLLKEKSLFGYGMILEKSRNYKELSQNINMIIKQIQNSQMLEKIKEIFINLLLKNSMESGLKEEILEKINLKLKEGVDENMSCLQERLVEEFRQEIRNEFKEGYKELLRPLILHKIPDSLILQSKKISPKLLKEIKKEVFEEEAAKNKKTKCKPLVK